ncbi:MAG: hypothetical protein ACERLG_07380 [Sedimentibacter sp.]
MKESKRITNDRYLEKLEDIKVRVPKGYRDTIKEYAKTKEMNTNQLVIYLINDAMKKDGLETSIPFGIKNND